MNISSQNIRIAQMAKAAIGTEAMDDEFKNFLKGLPAMIGQNGLLQTISYIKGKEGDRYQQLYQFFQTFFNDYFNPSLPL